MYTPKNILSYAQAKILADNLRRRGKKIVFVSGSYDIPHFGHVYFFQKARLKGDVLFVSLGSDKNIRILKGKTRPILNEKIRSEMIASLKPVDYVVLDREELVMPGKLNFVKLLDKIKPHIFAINNTDSAIKEKKALCQKKAIKLVLIDVTKGPDISTTKIINRIKGAPAF